MRKNRYSNLKIIAFPGKVQSFQSGEITAPISVRIKPINHCNHSCFWCVYSNGQTRKGDKENHTVSHMHEDMKETDIFPAEKMFTLIEELASIGVRALTFSGGGEPLLYPAIQATMKLALERGLDISVITNGQALTGGRAEVLCGARWVRVSMDYTNARQMAESRNVPEKFFDGVMGNLHDFASIKSPDCDLGVNYIITRHNFQGLVEFALRLRDAGVEDIRFSPMWLPEYLAYHEPHRRQVEEQLMELQQYCTDRFSINSTFVMEDPSKGPVRKYCKCLFMQVTPVIGADQMVYACHNTAYTKHGAIGSIASQSFSDLWFGPEAKAVFDGLNPIKSCRHECANDGKNVLYHELARAPFDNFV